MKRLCFGTLFTILYQAKAQKVTNPILCDAIFCAFGADSTELRDSSLPGHLKNGHDNVPPDVIKAARNSNFNDVQKKFQESVVPLVKDSYRFAIVRAIKDILKDDSNIIDSTVIGYIAGYEKSNILNSSTFNFAGLLSSVFRFAIVEVANQPCANDIRTLDKNIIKKYENGSDEIHFENKTPDEIRPLQKTLNDPNFGRVFRQVSSTQIIGLSNPTTAQIYSTNINNFKFAFKDLKSYLLDNIGSYVLSRAKIAESEKSKKAMAAGSQALIKFLRAYSTNADAVLGEMLLYIFLEQELDAPKIMSKIEINDIGGDVVSKSDGVHLLSDNSSGIPYHQLVFGASNIVGDMQTAVDRAFNRIKSIESNSTSELQMIENTTHNSIYDKETTNYMLSLLIPQKTDSNVPDMSFGIFLGYTMNIDPTGMNNNQFRDAVKTQLQQDIMAIEPYILSQIQSNSFEGYSFYFYIVPFNDAPNERTNLIDEMTGGY